MTSIFSNVTYKRTLFLLLFLSLLLQKFLSRCWQIHEILCFISFKTWFIWRWNQKDINDWTGNGWFSCFGMKTKWPPPLPCFKPRSCTESRPHPLNPRHPSDAHQREYNQTWLPHEPWVKAMQRSVHLWARSAGRVGSGRVGPGRSYPGLRGASGGVFPTGGLGWFVWEASRLTLCSSPSSFLTTAPRPAHRAGFRAGAGFMDLNLNLFNAQYGLHNISRYLTV